ncbi:MAG: Tetratricopeptide repeat-containing protein, partial [Acidobacteria bacterium]|nr:Tetratricopeptide repeat-containing protein [Acidobacteriota bacterium]
MTRVSAALAALMLLSFPLLAQTSGSPDAEALATVGRSAMSQGNADKAASCFEQAVAKKPNVSEYHLLLGQAYGTQAQHAGILSQAGLARKAKAELERAVQLDPNNLEARSGLVDYYVMAPGIMGGSDDKAREQANEIRKRDAFAGHRAFASIDAHDKQLDQARNEYIAAVREQPGVPKTHYWLGVFYMGEKNYKASLEEMEAALKIDPAYMPAVFQIGHVAVLSSSNLARGEEALRRYLTYKPQSGEPPI